MGIYIKQKKNINYYPRIHIYSKESKISRQIENALHLMKFNYGIHRDTRHLPPVICFEMSGIKMLEKWINQVNTKNLVHISKYLFWKKFGHYIPKSSLEERMRILDIDLSDYLTIINTKYKKPRTAP